MRLRFRAEVKDVIKNLKESDGIITKDMKNTIRNSNTRTVRRKVSTRKIKKEILLLKKLTGKKTMGNMLLKENISNG